MHRTEMIKTSTTINISLIWCNDCSNHVLDISQIINQKNCRASTELASIIPPPPLNINAISLIRLETKSCCIFTVIYFVYLIPFPENFCPVGSKKTGEGSFWCPSRIGNFHLVNIDLRIKKGDNPMEQDLRNMADVVKFPSQLSQFFVGSSKMAEYDTLPPPPPPRPPVDQSWAFFFFDFRLQFV